MMENSFYKLPLRLDQVIQKKRPASCSLKHSVAQNLHLLISTYRGESAYSDEFGCSLWDEEFNLQLNRHWKENVSHSLRQGILKFEKRLEVQDIKVLLEEKNEETGKDGLRVRRRLHVEITGMIRRTNEPFHFSDTIFISPLAQK